MSQRDATAQMRRMLDHSREIVAMVQGRSRRDLDTDRMFELALTQLLKLTGDAAGRVTTVDRARYAAVQWTETAGIRNRAVPAYDAVNLDAAWDIATREVPGLIAALEGILPGP